jgi:CRP-like cAMP-binding protein
MGDFYSLMMPRVEWALQALSAPVTLLKVAHGDLLALARARPAVAEAFWRDCVADGAIMTQWVVSLGRRDARARTAHLFCELGVRMEKAGLGTRTAFSLPAIQTQLADTLGMTPVHMNRIIGGLRADRLLLIQGREVSVPDWDGLAEAGGFDAGYLQMDDPVPRRLAG